MKFFSTLLAVLFFTLSILPCDDLFAYNDCGTEIHLHAEDGHDNHQEADFCSPFCVCHCCHSHTIITKKSKSSYAPFRQEKFPILAEQHHTFYSFSIWHPPQV